MARTKAVSGAGARLSDCVCASLLARAVPPEAVHAVLDEFGCNSQRVRRFPAVAGVYYCMALSLPREYGAIAHLALRPAHRPRALVAASP